MITVTYGHMQEQNFAKAVGKIANFTGYKSTKTTYNVAKIARKLNEEFKLLGTLHLELVKKFAEVDEKGELVNPPDRPPGSYRIRDEVKEEWFAACKDFNATEVKIDRDSLSLEDLVGVPLSPMELDALEPLMAKRIENIKLVKPAEVKEIKPPEVEASEPEKA